MKGDNPLFTESIYSHEDESRNFLGDPVNGFCCQCLCSMWSFDDECVCDCHFAVDLADGEE